MNKMVNDYVHYLLVNSQSHHSQRYIEVFISHMTNINSYDNLNKSNSVTSETKCSCKFSYTANMLTF